MRIGFLSSDWGDYVESQPGGCTWMRCITVSKKLNENGHEAIVGEVGWKDDEGFVAVPTVMRLQQQNRAPIKDSPAYFGQLDVVIFKLWMWHEAPEYIARAKAMGQTIIFDIDDYFDDLPKTNIAYQTTDPKRDKLWNRNHMLDMHPLMDGLITSTKFLYDHYSSKNQNTYLVRNALDKDYFIKRHDSAGDRPTIGWAGMIIWRSGDLQELQGILGPFLEKHDLRFFHAGIDPSNPKEIASLIGVDPERIDGITGTQAVHYPNILLPIDIGIVPLSKIDFNEAKSSLKGMEYAMAGIPFVSDSTYEYRMLEADGAGRVAKNPREWAKHLEYFIDPENRKRAADKYHSVILKKYNLDDRIHEWIYAIERIREQSQKKVDQLVII
jgi:hypothetical protein